MEDSVSRSPLAKGAKFSTPQKCVEHHALCEAQVQTFESCYYAELAFEKVKQTITQIYAMLGIPFYHLYERYQTIEPLDFFVI